jgi:hypothetical protein
MQLALREVVSNKEEMDHKILKNNNNSKTPQNQGR